MRPLDPPASEASFAPDLTTAGGSVLLTWIERLDADRKRHRVRFARLEGDAWSEPSTVAEGEDFFANWADFPAAVAAADGSLWTHWLAKTAAETYAYSIYLARSADGGATWEPRGKLHRDATDTEHGFVSWVPEGEGVRAFWLDGREMVAGGPMTLRTVALTADGPGEPALLDERVCECCSTDAAVAAAGPLVVYRDRSADEVRDIGRVRRTADGWTPPEVFSADDWRIEGCPVNGPEAEFDGERGAVAWFTAAEGAEVRVAFSTDGGASFGPARTVDGEAPLGRVDLALADDGAWVLWLAHGGGEWAEVRLARVSPDGVVGAPRVVAETRAARTAGVPRLARDGDRLVVAWVELGDGDVSRVRAAALDPAAMSGAG